MNKLGLRPRDFFGPDDWTGGDPQADVRRIKREQAEWDAARAKLPWWRRIFV